MCEVSTAHIEYACVVPPSSIASVGGSSFAEKCLCIVIPSTHILERAWLLGNLNTNQRAGLNDVRACI